MSTDILPAIGKPPSIELVPPDDLRIDLSYQRSIDNRASQIKIDRMRRRWDWRLCVPLLASRRADGLYVIDGQHRMVAAQSRGDIHYLPCCVGKYDSAADEAAIFIEANSTPQKVHRVDVWRAAVLAGDADALAVDRVLGGAGLALVATSLNGLKPGQINALGVVRTTIKRRGEEVALRTFAVLAEAYPNHIIPNIGVYCAALAKLLAVDGIDAEALVATLRRAVPYRWLERAKAHPAWGPGDGFPIALRGIIRSEILGLAPEKPVAVVRPTPTIATAPPHPTRQHRHPCQCRQLRPMSPPALTIASPPSRPGKRAWCQRSRPSAPILSARSAASDRG